MVTDVTINMMDGLQIIDTIKKINPWFKSNQVPTNQLELFKRREFLELEKTLSAIDQATLIIGGRRVGKSVLMYQLIDGLLSKGVNGKQILFIQGDNPIFPELIKDVSILKYILDVYQKYIIEQSFAELSEVIYIFIDEAHILKGWQLEIKSLIDLKYKIKFIITGSSSFELRRGSQNPLTGRIIIKSISPFSFSDFVKYNLTLETQPSFQTELLTLSEEFKSALFIGNIGKTYSQALLAEELVKKYSIRKKLDDYLFLGGFPWVVSHPKGDDVAKYLRDLLTTTISKDILTQVDAREPQAFERLMVNLCLLAGNIIQFKNFADILGIDERTVSKYVDYYADSHWAFISSPYAFHKKADSVKSTKKVYVIDNGIINTLSFKDNTDVINDKQYRGKIFENTLHNHLLSLAQTRIGYFQNSIPFWIEEESKKEIDFILEVNNGVIPIEAKCKVMPDQDDVKTIIEFLADKVSAKFGIITCEDTLKIENKLLFIPYSVLLLLL